MTCKLVIILALTLAAAIPALAGERVAEATPALEWYLYHDDACREADRIAAQCARGDCDKLALRHARHTCLPFGPLMPAR
jgi:hypothetical protein